MKLYGAQGVSPQVLLAYALSHGYQLSPPPALARTPLGKPYINLCSICICIHCLGITV